MPTLFATPPQPKAGYPHFERKIEADGKYELEDVKNGWGSLKVEHAYEITEIEGSIPKGTVTQGHHDVNMQYCGSQTYGF